MEARRHFSCIILNPFPKSLQIFWEKTPPTPRARQHYAPWEAQWEEAAEGWFQTWEPKALTRYYLYHLLLHELGHLNDQTSRSPRQRESFAEDFALTWARKLKAIT